ncbi:MAG: hypothetical protein U1E42_03590 [Rhodospirillales bacterium]
MTYRLTTDGSRVIRLADHAIIPADPANGDWQRYQAWLAAGGIPEAAAPDPRPHLANGAARRARQFAKALARDPLATLVTQAKETLR